MCAGCVLALRSRCCITKKSLTVIQMWHALGKIKQSGYQTLGKASGRGAEMAHLLKMHENYDYIIAGGKAWNPFYEKSFNQPQDKLVNCGLPADRSAACGEGGKPQALLCGLSGLERENDHSGTRRPSAKTSRCTGRRWCRQSPRRTAAHGVRLRRHADRRRELRKETQHHRRSRRTQVRMC